MDGSYCTLVETTSEAGAWWQVDLQAPLNDTRAIVFYNLNDGASGTSLLSRMSSATITLRDAANATITTFTLPATPQLKFSIGYCAPCPPSYYCSSGSPLLCPAGFHCPQSTKNPIPCSPGSYSKPGATSCTAYDVVLWDVCTPLRYVHISLSGTDYLNFGELMVLDTLNSNVALGKAASQSSTHNDIGYNWCPGSPQNGHYAASYAVDGNPCTL